MSGEHVRDEFWVRGDEEAGTVRAHVPVRSDGVVEIQYEVLARLMTEVGWRLEADA